MGPHTPHELCFHWLQASLPAHGHYPQPEWKDALTQSGAIPFWSPGVNATGSVELRTLWEAMTVSWDKADHSSSFQAPVPLISWNVLLRKPWRELTPTLHPCSSPRWRLQVHVEPVRMATGTEPSGLGSAPVSTSLFCSVRHRFQGLY